MTLPRMPRPGNTGPRTGSAQADHVAIESIEAGVVRLRDYPEPLYRAVLEVDGVEAPPEGSREEEAVLAAYAAFLNGLTFPFQLLVRVLPFDFDRYLAQLEGRMADACLADAALAPLAGDHLSFLRRLARGQTLLQRRFYVVVPGEGGNDTSPADSSVDDVGGPSQRPEAVAPEAGESANDRRRSIWPFSRLGVPVPGGRPGSLETDAAAAHQRLAFRCVEAARLLARSGLVARRLDDAALAELFYACWCPERSRVQRLRQQLEAYTVPVVHGVRPGTRRSHP